MLTGRNLCMIQLQHGLWKSFKHFNTTSYCDSSFANHTVVRQKTWVVSDLVPKKKMSEQMWHSYQPKKMAFEITENARIV